MYQTFEMWERNELRFPSEYVSDDTKPDWKHNMNGLTFMLRGRLGYHKREV